VTPSVTFWGAGTFAHALASCIAPHVKKIVMWVRSEKSFRSSSFVDRTTMCVAEASRSDIWIFCVPAQALRSCLTHIKSVKMERTPLICISTCKGIERSSGMLMTEILRHFFPKVPVAVIAGPNFASELTGGAFSGFTIGTQTIENFVFTSALFQKTQIHTQHVIHPDALSAWGALKNISALGCGVLWGLTQSHNTVCTFTTQAFVQSKTWIEEHIDAGAEAAALSYGGLGDFVMSCTSQSSRNFRYGVFLATQEKETPQNLVEGVESLYGILARNAQRHTVLPFATHLEHIVSQRIRPEAWLNQLCSFSERP
jgi:glycerol-3-phosphate dehydrogenase (NAD(P)+)